MDEDRPKLRLKPQDGPPRGTSPIVERMPEPQHRPPPRRLASRLCGLLVVLAVLGAAGAAAWWFFAQPPAGTEVGIWDNAAAVLESLATDTPAPADLARLGGVIEAAEAEPGAEDAKAGLAAVYALGRFLAGDRAVGAAASAHVRRQYGDTAYAPLVRTNALWIVCPACGGTGKQACPACRGTGRCPACGGTGQARAIRDAKPKLDLPGLQSTDDRPKHPIGFGNTKQGSKVCAFCKGSGDCPRCKGSGRIAQACEACGGTGRAAAADVLRARYREARERAVAAVSREQKKAAVKGWFGLGG